MANQTQMVFTGITRQREQYLTSPAQELNKFRSVETENDEYSGFDFVKQSTLMVNFTHEWDREIREWDICEKDKSVKLAAYYFMNYDCEFESLNCTTNGEELSLSSIFRENCFDDLKIVKILYPPDVRRVPYVPCTAPGRFFNFRPLSCKMKKWEKTRFWPINAINYSKK